MNKCKILYNPKINNFYNPDRNRTNNLFVLYNSAKYKQAINNSNRPSFPFVSAIELTNYCDANCLFCVRQAMTRPKGYMSDKLFHKLLNQYQEYETFIKISGFGENLLHPKFDYFITEIKKHNKLHLTSNCQRLSLNNIENMVKNKLDVLQISFQGTNKEDYEKQRKGSSFDKLISNIKTLVDYRGNEDYPFIHMSTTILDESNQQIEDFINICFDLGIDSVGVGHTEYGRFPDSFIKDGKIKDEINKFKAKQTALKDENHSYLYRYMDICWDGIAVSCMFDYDQFIPVGNANKNLLYVIWNHSNVMQALRVLEERKLLNKMKYFDSFHFSFHGGERAYNLRPTES